MQCNHGAPIASVHVVYTAHQRDQCLFRRNEPTMGVLIIYAFIVPVFAVFGLCANLINAIVFMRPKMTPSAFSYLAALSVLDCLSCLLIAMTAFSRSIFFNSTFWLAFDFQWQTPLFGITTGAANLILATLSFDRVWYLWNGVPNGTPRFCRRKVARRMIAGVILISCAVNVPYFFVFEVNKDGTIETTAFYYSQFYKIHNWFTFVLLAVLPAIFLLVGNALIIVAFRRWTKQAKQCQKNSSNKCTKASQKRYIHQMKLTVTIFIVITLYMIGELPAHLTSRKSALNLLFNGNTDKVDLRLMERLELICITLNALQLSMNIIVYAVINPCFMPEFFICLRGASDTCFKICCCLTCAGYIRSCWKRRQGDDTAVSVADPVSICHINLEEDRISNGWSSAGEIEDAQPPPPHIALAQMHGILALPEPKLLCGVSSESIFRNRSSSLLVYGNDNMALDIEETHANVPQWRPPHKRHSTAL